MDKVVREGGLRDARGNLVPVTVVHSSLSDTEEEVNRVLDQVQGVTHSSADDTGESNEDEICTPHKSQRTEVLSQKMSAEKEDLITTEMNMCCIQMLDTMER